MASVFITNFSIFTDPYTEYPANISGADITVTLPAGTDVTNLRIWVTQTSPEYTVDTYTVPATWTYQDFTNPVTITAYTADRPDLGYPDPPLEAEYLITVTVEEGLTAFVLPNGLDPGIVNQNDYSISCLAPVGIDVSNLAPTITYTGASLSPESGVSQNFTSPVEYTLTKADLTTLLYTATFEYYKECNITFTTDEGGFQDSCVLRVIAGTGVSGVSLSITSTGLSLGGNNTVLILAAILPPNATVKTGVWTSSDPLVADVLTVEGVTIGLITAVALGDTTITFTTTDGGYTASCVIHVVSTISVTGASITPAEATIAVGNTFVFNGTVVPTNATDTTLFWSSVDEGVATVDPYGIATGISVGSTGIICTSEDGSFTSTGTLFVTSTGPAVPVTGVSLNRAILDLAMGETYQLIATVSPANATNKAVYWSSDSAAILVDQTGKVTRIETQDKLTPSITVGTSEQYHSDSCDINQI